jgi:hypothetical protein
MGHDVALTLSELIMIAMVIAVPGASREVAVMVADLIFVLQNS